MLFIARMLLMGLHFVIAGVAGLLLCICRPFNPDNSRLCARLYSIPALWILRINLKTEVSSLFAKKRACVIIANHQSNYDLYVLGRVVPERTVSLGKKSLKWVPFFGQLYWLAGNVLLDRGNARKAKQAMQTTTETLKNRDTSIWVFPEGTRNPGQQLFPFKRGAFQMAIDAGVPIIPVCTSHYASTVKLGRWNTGKIMIRSLAPIETAHLTHSDMPALIEQCRVQMQDCIDQMTRELIEQAAG
ncbi:1-acylglycerol-3-phosphate O-acyltransferase [Pseudomonas sp.]|uniref:1-acylglycerol-3-phosphate O-acyltransferase n=1 Tax=Pseudomonas sp. TaxID=306 RepID=UPI00257F0836|nr:1-acylglycerol-3-phosphate O-acyltransferase [Pseudomonas sp.]